MIGYSRWFGEETLLHLWWLVRARLRIYRAGLGVVAVKEVSGVTSREPVDKLLGDLSGMGPFFDLQIWVDEGAADRWRPLETLLTAEALCRRSEQMARHLAGQAGISPCRVEPRVAASVMHLGVAARLTSPWIGLAALGILLPVRLEDLRWSPVPGSGFSMSVSPRTFDRERSGNLAQWANELIEELLAPLTNLAHGSSTGLWGNLASAVNGGVVAAGYTRPALQPAMRSVAESVLRALPVRPTYQGTIGTARFRRCSCCLLYRVEGRGLCGDCVLLDRGTRHA